MIAEEIAETASETVDTAKEIAELHIKKVKLDAAEGLSRVSIKAISFFIKLLLVFNAVFFISMGLALIIGELLGIQSIGYFIIGALFIAALVVFSLLKKLIIERPVVRMYIEMFFKN